MKISYHSLRGTDIAGDARLPVLQNQVYDGAMHAFQSLTAGKKALAALILFALLIGGFIWFLKANGLGCTTFCAAR